MKVKLPNRLVVNPRNLPEDFDDQVRRSFAEFTEGTNRDYTYTDRLGYIDLCARYVNGVERAWPEDEVMELMKNHFEHNVSEYGEFPDKRDFLNVEFMAHCFDHGQRSQKLKVTQGNYRRYKDRHDAEAVEKMLCRVINVVMAYEKEVGA